MKTLDLSQMEVLQGGGRALRAAPIEDGGGEQGDYDTLRCGIAGAALIFSISAAFATGGIAIGGVLASGLAVSSYC